MMANSVEAISRHHRARFLMKLATPGKMIPVEIDSEFAAGGIQNANTLWDNFLADAVSGNGCDTVALHWLQKIGQNTPPSDSDVRVAETIPTFTTLGSSPD
jgi:hypothetical protein